MFAIVRTGGKQFKVRVGETIDVEKLEVEEGAEVRLDQVLLAVNDSDVAYGRPVIDGAVVTAGVVSQGKGVKLIVFRYKSKSRYRRRTGHRQKLTRLAIQSIDVPGWEIARAETAAAPVGETEVSLDALAIAAVAPPTSAVAPVDTVDVDASEAPSDAARDHTSDETPPTAEE